MQVFIHRDLISSLNGDNQLSSGSTNRQLPTQLGTSSRGRRNNNGRGSVQYFVAFLWEDCGEQSDTSIVSPGCKSAG